MSDLAPFSFLSRIRLLTAFILLATLFEAVLVVLVPFGVYFFAAQPKHDRDGIYDMIGALAGAAVAGFFAGLLKDRMASLAQLRVIERVRMAFFERLPYLEAPADRFPRDLDILESAIAGAAPRAALPFAEAWFCLGLMLWLDWRAGLVGLLFWPWIVLGPALAAAYTAKARSEQDTEKKKLFGLLTEASASSPVTRFYGIDPPGQDAFRRQNSATARVEGRVAWQAATMDRFNVSGVLFIRLALFAASALLVLYARMSVAVFVGIQIAGYALSKSLLTLGSYWNSLGDARSAWQRIQNLLDTPAAPADQPGARGLPPLRSEIGLSGVTFGYDDDATVISGVTLRVPRGANVAFAGVSGSGKSTLLKLLVRQLQPQSGTVSIDGHDIRNVTRASLMARAGIVPEENLLLNLSIRDNIRIAKPDASAEAVVSVANAVGLHEFVVKLPRGYDTLVENPGASVLFPPHIVQRIALARALVHNPDVLLLDDVSTSLEPLDEESLQPAIRDLQKGRTVIAASRRLSAIAAADHIFVLDNGVVTEQGSHADLIALDGLYAWLWAKQAGFRIAPDGQAEATAERLSQVFILDTLSAPALAAVMPYFVTETFHPGRFMVREEDPGDKMYIMVRGKAEASRAGEEPRILEDGDSFAELALLAGVPNNLTVVPLTICTCLTLSRGHFTRVVERFPEVERAVAEVAVRELRQVAQNASARAARTAAD